MAKHRDPYQIKDPTDIFEVIANSSHPELIERKRVIHFNAYTFKTCEALQSFFTQEGLNPKGFWIKPRWENNGDGTYTNHIDIIEAHKRFKG
ncbi:MAG: hypothetical protein IPQ08_06165 [Chitinophagaceae bacterium]|nr:hypothetical protein [Chitinophagaceae bacterium]